MRIANYQARLLTVCLVFLMLAATTATARSSVTQNINDLELRIEDQEALDSDSLGQLVQTNKLSSDIRTVQLELINDTYCELSLCDLKGNCIQTIEAEQKKKGKHLVLWRHTDIAAGTYLLKLYTNYGDEHIELVLE